MPAEAIALIGLGQMGAAIAANLLKAGHPLRVYNRTPEKARPLVERGATLASSPLDVLSTGAKVVFTMLTDDRAVIETVHGPNGFAPSLAAGAVHVSMSTIAPATAAALAEQHEKRGAAYVSAPVFGKPDAAAAAKLIVALSGNAAARERVKPLLAPVAARVVEFGDNPAAAPTVKLAGNFMIGAAIEAMAEAYTLAEKTGVDRAAVHELFSTTLFGCPIYQNYGKMIAAEHYQPAGAPPALIRKDMRLLLEHAGRQQVPMPLGSLVYDRLTAAVNRGQPDVDWTVFAAEVSRQAGTPESR